MHTRPLARFAAGLGVLATATAALSATKPLWQVVSQVKHRPGAPLPADVVMRSLRLHPSGPNDPHDTWKALEDFHATRLEWCYIHDKDFVERVTSSGRIFGGAVSSPSYLAEKPDPQWFDKLAVKDLAGRPIIAPWKRTWKRTLWGCVNNPEYHRGYVAFLERYMDAGAQTIQRDEPQANYLATKWGACFCDHCMALFRRWLALRLSRKQLGALRLGNIADFDYRAFLNKHKAAPADPYSRWRAGELKKLFLRFQHDSTIGFHRATRQELEAHVRHRVPFSCNNGATRCGEIELLFDWWFGELAYSLANPADLHSIFKKAAANQRVQVVTMPKKGDYRDLAEWERRTRQTIATAYACGGLCMVPWDVYMPNDAPRYFGQPRQYADLYAFVRANPHLFNDYWEAAVAGAGLSDERYEQPPVALAGGTGRVMAVVRAKAGEPAAPIVIHLIEWGARGQPFTVKLRRTYFGGRRRRFCELLTPVPYDPDAHRQAQRSGNFSALSRRRRLPAREVGVVTLVQVPPLEPWGILVVR